MNFASLLDLHRRNDPDAPAVRYEDVAWTYGELDTRVNRFANLLEARDVADGDRVALLAPNVPEYVVAYFGAIKRGAVPVPVNNRLGSEEIAYVIGDAEPTAVFVSHDLADTLPAPDDTTVEFVQVFGPSEPIDETLAPYPAEFDTVTKQNREPASIMYTSGSTGSPKGVVHQHGYDFAVAGGRVAFFELDRTDVGFVLSPAFHISGETIMLMAVYLGCPFVLQRDWGLERFLENLERHGVTFMHLITTVLVEIAESSSERLDRYDTAELVLVVTGGGSLTAEQIEFFETHVGGFVSEGYGRTEGGSAFNPIGARRPSSNGVPLENSTELRVVDPSTNRPQPPSEEGEIVVRGDGVTVGYHDRPGLTGQYVDDDGWMHTEDLGRFDEDGYLYFTGRMDDMIKTGGENVHPREVERILLSIPGVSEAVVVGTPDPKWGERVSAAVVTEDESITEAAIDSRCRKRLAGFKVPRRIVFFDALPKQGSQKINRSVVADMVAESAEE